MTERLTPGDPAPEFSLPTDNGDTLTLKDLRGRKVILYVYPAAMTPGCTTQACDFRDSLGSLQAAGYEVVGISPDVPAKLAKFRDRDAITFPLVSDQDKSVLTAYGAFGEKQLYGKTVTGVIRSTFVIDENGAVQHASTTSRRPGTSPSYGGISVSTDCQLRGSCGSVPMRVVTAKPASIHDPCGDRRPTAAVMRLDPRGGRRAASSTNLPTLVHWYA